MTQPTFYVVDYERPEVPYHTKRLRTLYKSQGRTVVYTDRHLAEAAARALYRGRVYTVDSKGYVTKQGGS